MRIIIFYATAAEVADLLQRPEAATATHLRVDMSLAEKTQAIRDFNEGPPDGIMIAQQTHAAGWHAVGPGIVLFTPNVRSDLTRLQGARRFGPHDEANTQSIRGPRE